MRTRKDPADSPTCWSSALTLDDLQGYLRRDYGDHSNYTDMPEPKDFPILYEVRPWNGMYELSFFSRDDAKYLLSLAGIYVV